MDEQTKIIEVGRCPVSIGDQIKCSDDGVMRTVTDILVMYWVGSGDSRFLFQLDGTDDYAELNIVAEDAGDAADKKIVH